MRTCPALSTSLKRPFCSLLFTQDERAQQKRYKQQQKQQRPSSQSAATSSATSTSKQQESNSTHNSQGSASREPKSQSQRKDASSYSPFDSEVRAVACVSAHCSLALQTHATASHVSSSVAGCDSILLTPLTFSHYSSPHRLGVGDPCLCLKDGPAEWWGT